MLIELRDGMVLQLSQHALARYHERICPALSRGAALEHLHRLAALVGERDDRPAWSLADERFHPQTSEWVALGPDIGLIVRGSWAITVLCRGSVSETEGHRRRRRRRGRKAYTRWQLPNGERAKARRRRRDGLAPGLEDEAA